jgi:pyruvate-formate lyase-activating enzyme
MIASMETGSQHNMLEKEIRNESFPSEKIRSIMTTFYEVLQKPFAEKLFQQLKTAGLEIPPALLQSFEIQMKD